MPDERRGLSRRGLFGLFRGAGERGDSPPSARPMEPEEEPSYPRIQRAESEIVQAEVRPGGVFQVDGLNLAVGASVRVEAADLFEAVVVCRVNDVHVAACSSECPLDASDLAYRAEADALVCPACGSTWRLDGAHLSGPARYDVASYVVEAYDDAFRIHDR